MNLLRRYFLVILTIAGFATITIAQNSNYINEAKQKLKSFQQQQNYLNDTAYINALTDLAYLYSSGFPDSALLVLKGIAERCKASGYAKGELDTYVITGDAFFSKGMYKKALENFEKSYSIAKNNNYQSSLSLILNRIGTVYFNQGNYPEALSKYYESLKKAEERKDNNLIGATLNNIANIQFYQNEFNEAESTYRRRLAIAQYMHDTSSMSHAYNNIGEVNLQQKNAAKALHNLIIAYNLAQKINDREMLLNTTLSIADAYYLSDSLQKSVSLYENALALSKQTDHGSLICGALIGLAKAHYKQGLLKQALANGLEGLERAEKMGQVQLMRDASEIVSTVYEAMNDGSNALKYYKQYKTYSDSIDNLASQRAVTIEKAKYEISKKESEFQRETLQQRWLTFSAFAGLALLAVILWIILRNRNRLKHTYKELQYKNVIIETEKSKAEETLLKLQTTQAQLIQSEKMASLGELTAGIAHEIQNPLNFVNNFSEINNEMLQELQEERLKPITERDEELETELINDVISNGEKINHHGKRADGIVKSMLQHSRKNSEQKVQTDINALCDEYLRLSYHGLRAKDKSFNAEFKTAFDESIGKINVVPQDMGRVLLNLFNNAFYAVNEKSQSSAVNSLRSLPQQYKPLVSVITRRINIQGKETAIEIKVEDNGNGISPGIIDKIFQPFYTTKPTGQGTGLGLSLAYDIIKEHNGTIKVNSKEGEGSAFIISLPVNN